MLDTTDNTVENINKVHKILPLRLILPGGEGHLGRLLAQRFSALGHKVTTLTRALHSSDASVYSEGSTGDSQPWKTVTWDGRTRGAWEESLEGADILINLAGRSVDCRYNVKNREEILQSRVLSTAILGEALQAMKHVPRVWLNASTATIYRHSYDREMDEATGEAGGAEPDAPATWRFSIQVAQRWEEAFFSSPTPNTRKIAMRAAMVMSPSPGGIFEILLRLVRLGMGGAWGDGRQYMSWIHEEDFLRAVEFLIRREDISGAVNLAAPVPLPNSEFMAAVRTAWGTRVGLPASEWMLACGAFFLRTETELLLKSRRAVPGILHKNGFEFCYREWPAAARDLVSKWRERSSSAGRTELVSGVQGGSYE